MGVDTLLQVLLFFQVFVMGVLAAVGWRHYKTHFRTEQTERDPELDLARVSVDLPPAVKEHMIQSSKAQFERALHNAAAQLQNDLDSTNSQVNDLVIRLAAEMVSAEMQRYKEELAKLKDQAQSDMGGVRSEITKHEQELKDKMATEVEAEKQKLIKQIDTKLADAVGSFLIETLPHNVDLGSQSNYLVQMLEEHKDDFMKEVKNEN